MKTDPSISFGTVAPQFIVSDVEKTAEFYRDALGFQITDYFLNPPVHAIVTRGQSQVFLGKANGPIGISNRFLKPVGIDAYFRVSGVELLMEQFQQKRVKIIEGLVLRDYGITELVIEDCNGFVLVFGEDTHS